LNCSSTDFAPKRAQCYGRKHSAFE